MFWATVLIFILINGCQKGGKILAVKKIIDGVVHVYNSDKPLKGTISLRVKELLRIDSLSIDAENPPALHLFSRDPEKNIFLCDRQTPRMYRFSPDGRLLNQFLKKGEGPGEFPQGIYSFQILNNSLWMTHSRKLVRFNLTGDFIREWKFNRTITFIEMPDEEKLIGNIYKNDLTEDRKRICAVFDRNGQDINPLFEDKNAGFTEIRMQNNGSIQILRFFSGPITNDILHTYDPGQNRIYLFLSSDYQIFRKDLLGKTDLVIHRNHRPAVLTETDKTDIIAEIFSSWPPERRKLLNDVFPKTFVAINLIGILPRGHIAVRRILGFKKYVFDVFDSRGQFVYILEPPQELPGFYRIDLSGKLIWIFKEIEDRDVFILYEMTNLPI